MEIIKQNNKQVRAIVKAVLFCILFTVLLVILSFFKSFVPGQYERFAYGLLGTAAAFGATYVFLRMDKRSFTDIGLQLEKTTLLKFIKGLLFGLVLTIIMFFCLVIFGNMKLELNEHPDVMRFLFWTLALLPLAFMEEVAFRAYPLVVLNRGTGLRTSLFVMALLFALYHIANGWTIGVAFLGPGIWGLVFGLAAIYSNGIAMPTGIHYAVNLVQTAIGKGIGFPSIWTLKPQEELSSVHSAQWIGIILQILLLLFALTGIEWFVRKKAAANIRLAQL